MVTSLNPMTTPCSSTRFIIVSVNLVGRSSAARIAARMDLALREWIWGPDPGATGVRFFALVPPEILAVIAPPRYAGDTD